ncbi:MAG: hypothetical protein HY658_00095 [Actinobacteria bacterium]|nr:hypothetical protein [Actinomycetota bacterium]
MDVVGAGDDPTGDGATVVVPEVELSGLPETVGHEVTRILGAAQLAADRIRTEARRDVAGVRARAERLQAGLEGVLGELRRVLGEAGADAPGEDAPRAEPGDAEGPDEEDEELSVVEQLRRLAT